MLANTHTHLQILYIVLRQLIKFIPYTFIISNANIDGTFDVVDMIYTLLLISDIVSHTPI